MSSEKFCLRWNDFETNISVAFRELRDDKDFFDVTIACEDEQLQAHKVILSACSPFFRNVLRRNPHQHPLLYLKGVKYTDLQSVLNFMYHGEVNVAQEELNSFLAVAEELRVKGLTQNNQSAATNRIKETYSAPRSPSAPKVRPPPERDPIPPPKRPRPTITTPTFPVSQEDDDIQEVVPVKTEPRETAPLPPPPPPQQQQQQTYHHSSPAPVTPAAPIEPVGQLQEMDESLQQFQGDESYDDYGQYGTEGGYEEGGLGDPSMGHADAAKGRDKEDINLYMGSNSKKIEGGQYLCLICSKVTSHSGNMRQHFTTHHWSGSAPGSGHQESPSQGVTCQYCGRTFKNNNSLSSHVSQNHKQQRQAEKAGINPGQQVPGNQYLSPQFSGGNGFKFDNSPNSNSGFKYDNSPSSSSGFKFENSQPSSSSGFKFENSQTNSSSGLKFEKSPF